jgi:hypothetical protein
VLAKLDQVIAWIGLCILSVLLPVESMEKGSPGTHKFARFLPLLLGFLRVPAVPRGGRTA